MRAFILLLMFTIWAGSAAAQQMDPYLERLSVIPRYGDKMEPFDPNGLDLSLIAGDGGGFWSSMILRPEADIRTTYDDNIYISDGNAQSDLITTARTSLELRSNWERHGIKAIIGGASSRYRDHEADSHDAFSASFEGSLDLSPIDRLRGYGGYEDKHLDRYGLFARGDEAWLHTKESRYGAEYVHELDLPVGVSVKADQRQIDYMEGLNSASRVGDRTVTRIEGRANYNFSPDLGVFIAPAYQSNDFRESRTIAGLEKNSYISEFLTGISLQRQDLWYFELAVGVNHLDFAEASYLDAWTTGIRGRFLWTPLEYLSFHGTLKREIIVSDRLINEEAVMTGGDVEMNYAVLEELRLKANFGYYHAAFQRSGRIDDNLIFGAGAEYRFNPNVRLQNDYTHRERESNTTGFDLDNNLVTLNLRLNL